MAKLHPTLRAYIVLGFGVLGLGFSGIFVSWANAPGVVTAFYRMGVAAAVVTLPFWHHTRTLDKIPRREAALAMLAGIFFAADTTLWNSGILISGATTPTLMGNTAPVWVGVGALILFGEQLNRFFWLGLTIALIGAAIIIGIDAINDVGLGTFYGLLAGIFYGAYFLTIQRSRQKLDTLTTFWIMAATATAVLFVTTLLFDQPILGYSQTTYLNFLALGLVVQLWGQYAASYALGYLPASLVSPTLLLQPILTGIFAVPLLNERFTWLQLLGGTAVLVGVYIVHRSRQH